MDQIILTGFMGAGKTTVGEILSELTALPQIDIDSEIIAEQGCPVSDIFEQKGEQGFRDLEHQKLKEVLQKKAIISTGGGIVLRPENREVLKSFSPVIYLKTDPAIFLERLEGDTDTLKVSIAAAKKKHLLKFVLFLNHEFSSMKRPPILSLKQMS